MDSQRSLSTSTTSPGNAFKLGLASDGYAGPEHTWSILILLFPINTGLCKSFALPSVYFTSFVVAEWTHLRIVRKGHGTPSFERPINELTGKLHRPLRCFAVSFGDRSRMAGYNSLFSQPPPNRREAYCCLASCMDLPLHLNCIGKPIEWSRRDNKAIDSFRRAALSPWSTPPGEVTGLLK